MSMESFPYSTILKLAYELTKKRYWLWIFGLFVGGASGLNIGAIKYLTVSRDAYFPQLVEKNERVFEWINQNPTVFWGFVGLAVAVFAVLIVLQGLARSAVTWSAMSLLLNAKGQISKEKINFKNSLARGRRFVRRIILLQILVTTTFFVCLFLFSTPVVYLFSTHAIGRAVILLLLGLTIFIPAGAVFGFLHLYGPIIVVLYDRTVADALRVSFDLVRHKLKESIILAAFLIGLYLLFILALSFGIILFSVPVAILTLLLWKLELWAAVYALVIFALLAAGVYTVILRAGFAVFHNIAWVLAVEELVRTKKLEDEARVPATEPVAE